MADYGSSQFGYFLKADIWREALRLVNYQVSQRSKNRHYNTLSMIYYERLGEQRKYLEEAAYFQTRVANSLFYGLEDEFAFLSYATPKSRLGLRNYKFFTLPMRTVYYSVGLYLLKLSQEFVTQYAVKNSTINSYYGGNLCFKGSELQISHNATYFKKHYSAFRRKVRRQTDEDVDRKLVMRLDITDYFDNISIPTLLQLLSQSIKPSVQKEMRFDASTIEQITNFFEFISGTKRGIPQADNDVVSSFLGYLYLVFGDLFIESILAPHTNLIDAYSIIRYVDDAFIVIVFKPTVSQPERDAFANDLVARVADVLYHKLSLNMNPKTKIYWLHDEQQRQELLRSLKKVSPPYYLANDEDDEEPQNKVNNILDELRKLKAQPVDPLLEYSRQLEEEIFREVYDKRVGQLLALANNLTRLAEIFTDFNFEHIKARPRELIIILHHDKAAATAFKQYLLQKANLTSRDVELILHFLAQSEFNDDELLGKLSGYEPMAAVMEVFSKKELSCKSPGYYELTESQVLVLAEKHAVIEQMRLRIMSERIGAYSIALNHLLNEIHLICWLWDDPTKRMYKADDTVKYLVSLHVPHEVCIGIRNLFDRRNTNQVSHPGTDTNAAWSVSAEEYRTYRDYVGRCLQHLL